MLIWPAKPTPLRNQASLRCYHTSSKQLGSDAEAPHGVAASCPRTYRMTGVLLARDTAGLSRPRCVAAVLLLAGSPITPAAAPLARKTRGSPSLEVPESPGVTALATRLLRPLLGVHASLESGDASAAFVGSPVVSVPGLENTSPPTSMALFVHVICYHPWLSQTVARQRKWNFRQRAVEGPSRTKFWSLGQQWDFGHYFSITIASLLIKKVALRDEFNHQILGVIFPLKAIANHWFLRQRLVGLRLL